MLSLKTLRSGLAKGDSPPGTKLVPVASEALGPLQAAQPWAPGEMPCGPPLLWVAGWHLDWGQATPPPPLPAQSVMQFLHKSTRRRKKQNNKRCPGPTPATGHSSCIGKVWPPAPCSYAMAGAGIPAPLAAHRHDAGLSVLHCSASAPAPGPPPGTARFCAVPALSLGKFTVLVPAARGSCRLEKRSRAGHQGHAPRRHDLHLNRATLREWCTHLHLI